MSNNPVLQINEIGCGEEKTDRLLGYFQYSVRSLLGDLLSFVAIIGYLILLRLLGVAAVRAVEWRERVIVARHNAAVVSKKEARVQSRLSKTNDT